MELIRHIILTYVKSLNLNILHNSSSVSFIRASAPSSRSIIVTTLSTTYPASLNFSTALIAEPPVVVTSSNTVIFVPSLGNGHSIHA